MQRDKSICGVIAAVTMLSLICSAQAGVFTTALLSGDADSGISDTKTYTHTLNFAAGSTATINGVDFSPATAGANAGLQYDLPGSFQTLGTSIGDANISGDSQKLFHNFLYNNPSISLTLDGLTAGKSYRAVFYAIGWGNPGGRYNTVTDGLGGSILYDQNFSGNAHGNMLIANYTTTGSSVTFSIEQNRTDANPGVPNTTNTPDRYHFYAFSNEIVPEPAALTLLGPTGMLLLLRRRR